MAKNSDPPASGPGTGVLKTFGPVDELEEHLPSEWWRTLFNALYVKTDGDVVEDVEMTTHEIDLALRFTGIGRADRVLDLCCGQGRHSLELARRGHRKVTGIDRSRYLIRLARRRAKKENLTVAFREGDARRLRMPHDSFDCVMVLGNSYGYFETQDEDASVLEQIRLVLRPGGTVLLDIADGKWLQDHYQRRSWEWIDANQFVCRERQLSRDGGRLVTREVIVDAEKGVLADQFYAERLYDAELMQSLLVKAGFEAPRLHARYETESGRDQDLGMMAHRLWITATNGEKARQRRAPKVIFPNVTVVMGDPALPDAVKLNGRFNEEDLVTISKLKTSLGALTDYGFDYVDDHGTLIDKLRAQPPQFVLNLCDEGYRNDPNKELHVPAILEMLVVPYSGAGPTCLGMCYDKHLISAIAHSLDVPVPAETYITPGHIGGTLPSVFPALIKPARGDSSMGITQDAVVHGPEEALEYVEFLRTTLNSPGILVQEFLPGAEYTVAIIGNRGLGYTFLPLLEVDYDGLPEELPRLLSYESKWQPDSPYWTDIRYREASVSEDVARAMIDHSVRLFESVGCRDYARFDFRCDAQGRPKLLEVNPNPGWCWDGKFNLMAEMGGHSYADVLSMIIAAAQRRYAP